LPQLGQVRWGSVLMTLTVLQRQSEPKATPRATEWCESGQHSPWQTVVSLHKQLRVSLYYRVKHVSEQNSYRWCPAASGVDNDFRGWGGSKLTAVNRRLPGRRNRAVVRR
jgi:hypothetical protein